MKQPVAAATALPATPDSPHISPTTRRTAGEQVAMVLQQHSLLVVKESS